MITFSEALTLISANTRPGEIVSERPETGRYSASAVRSPVNVPGFANSAMDGFAVKSHDCQGDAKLKVAGTIIAGSGKPAADAGAGSAYEIMTGAVMPDGYDSVVPVERTRQSDTGENAVVVVGEQVSAGLNVRLPGEDFSENDPVLEAGGVITPEVLMGLAAVGANKIPQYARPRVSIITTGNELAEVDNESESLDSGMIHDANRPFLEAAIERSGAVLASSVAVGDEATELQNSIKEAASCSNIILTTGGVSAGRMDFVPGSLTDTGAEIIFHKVAIRPGKPLLFAKLSDGTLVFGLPGNPVAVAACFRFFVTAAIRQMLGQTAEQFSTALLSNDVKKKPGLCFFGKARSNITADGVQQVELLPGQQSFKIRPLTNANCWLILDEKCSSAETGETVKIAAL